MKPHCKFVALLGAIVMAVAGCTDVPSESSALAPTLAKGGGKGPPSGGADTKLTVTLPTMVDAATPNAILHDGSPDYTDGECKVLAIWQDTFADDPNDEDGMTTRLRFRPFDGSKKKLRNCSSIRFANLDVGLIFVHTGPGNSDHIGEVSLGSGYSNLGEIRVADVQETASVGLGRATLNTDLCLDEGGAGPGMRFNPAQFPGSTKLSIESIGPRKWLVRSQANPDDNRAWCETTSGDTLLLHVNLAFEVEEIS